MTNVFFHMAIDGKEDGKKNNLMPRVRNWKNNSVQKSVKKLCCHGRDERNLAVFLKVKILNIISEMVRASDKCMERLLKIWLFANEC